MSHTSLIYGLGPGVFRVASNVFNSAVCNFSSTSRALLCSSFCDRQLRLLTVHDGHIELSKFEIKDVCDLQLADPNLISFWEVVSILVCSCSVSSLLLSNAKLRTLNL